MTHWALRPMCLLDCETTGVSVENDRIVTIALGHTAYPRQPFTDTWLISPDIDIPAEATAIHGITTEHARAHGRPAADVLQEATRTLAAWHQAHGPIVAMNAVYDLTILDRDCRRHGVPTLTALLGRDPWPVVDIMVIDKWIDPYRKGKRKLNRDLIDYYGARTTAEHDAAADALAAARVAYLIARRAHLEHKKLAELYRDRDWPNKIIERFQMFGDMTLPELHAKQAGWYSQQGKGLATHWRREANEKTALADLAAHAGHADRMRELRAVAEKLLADADSIGAEWPIVPWREPSHHQEVLL